jgi:hypothetical protein
MNRNRSIAASLILAAAVLLAPPPAGASDFHVHGLLDLVAAEHGEANEYNALTRGDSPFDAYGVRFFGDVQVSQRLQIFSQVVLRDASSPYVDGAYAMFTPFAERDLHVLGGKIPWPIGTYAPRTYSNKNPLIGSPLLYQYHSTLLWFDLVPSADALFATAGAGQDGVNYEGYEEGFGMPVVDDSYWDVGASIVGSQAPFEYALGVVAGTPGWGSTTQDENSGKSMLARIGWAPMPGLRLGVSGAYGPYLVRELQAEMPAGRSVEDYHQKLGMADAEVMWGHLEARAEGARNWWETPTVGELEVTGGYLELEYRLPVGFFVAGRWDALRFGEITGSDGVPHPWDSDVTRVEGGAGYRFDRNVTGKIVHQHTRLEHPLGGDRRFDLFAAQLSIGF